MSILDLFAKRGPHEVQPGDTYWRIAREYRTSVKRLMQLNDYQPHKIPVGAKIKVTKYDKVF